MLVGQPLALYSRTNPLCHRTIFLVFYEVHGRLQACIATWGRPTPRQYFSDLITTPCQVWSRWIYPLPYYSVFAADTLLYAVTLTFDIEHLHYIACLSFTCDRTSEIYLMAIRSCWARCIDKIINRKEKKVHLKVFPHTSGDLKISLKNYTRAAATQEEKINSSISSSSSSICCSCCNFCHVI